MPSIVKFGHLKAISVAVDGKPVTPITPQEAPADLPEQLSMKTLAEAHEDLVLRLVEAGVLIPAAAEPEEEDAPQGGTPTE